eukprot:m.20350 g.20350  ORF g.20350 m.20350 type:complete len:50 (-) comp12458_c0_seq2:63-212(-)
MLGNLLNTDQNVQTACVHENEIHSPITCLKTIEFYGAIASVSHGSTEFQ